jgi:hypothetical protein
LILQARPNLNVNEVFCSALRHTHRGNPPQDNEITLQLFLESDLELYRVYLSSDGHRVRIGYGPLIVSAIANPHTSLSTLRLLLKKYPHGANATSRRGSTPLLLAALQVNYEKMALLLSHGADTEAGLDHLDGSHYLESDDRYVERDSGEFRGMLSGGANRLDTCAVEALWYEQRLMMMISRLKEMRARNDVVPEQKRTRQGKGRGGVLSTKEMVRKRIPKAASGDLSPEPDSWSSARFWPSVDSHIFFFPLRGICLDGKNFCFGSLVNRKY